MDPVTETRYLMLFAEYEPVNDFAGQVKSLIESVQELRPDAKLFILSTLETMWIRPLTDNIRSLTTRERRHFDALGGSRELAYEAQSPQVDVSQAQELIFSDLRQFLDAIQFRYSVQPASAHDALGVVLEMWDRFQINIVDLWTNP